MENVNDGAALGQRTYCHAASRGIEPIKVTVMPDGRLRRSDAAAYLSLSPRTLANMQTRGVGPRSVKVAGRRFYYLTDLQAFVAGLEMPR